MNRLLIFLFIPFLFAGTFVFHDGETITGKRKSCGAVCSQRKDAIRIDNNTYDTITKFHKVVDGKVLEMTKAEKEAILKDETDVKEQSILDAIDRFEVTNLELLIALIQRINVRIPNNSITKAEIIQQLKDNR